MKPSKYNITIDNEDGYVVYNTLNDSLMLCTPEHIALLEGYRDRMDDCERVHPSLYRYLKEKSFIVPDDLDETKKLLERFLQEDEDETYYSLTVNPTLNCNLACWYCYEEHLAGSDMTSETRRAVERLIERVISNGKTREFNLGFFGGEPLLGFRRCVKPLIEHADSLCKAHDVRLTLGFTSNAVLLSREIVDFLASTGLSAHMQIPFDGGRAVHDTIKKTHSGAGTYDRTLSNLKYAVSQGIYVAVRCNYTNESVHSFASLLDDLEPFCERHLDRMHFSFHRIWQDEERRETEEIVRGYESRIAALGGAYYSLPTDRSRCYADKKHSTVINYNGDMYQCTAREFTAANCEGKLLSDGTVEYNERYRMRMESRFSNPECLACSLFPICKICTQKRLEHDRGKCVVTDDKQLYIVSAVKARIAAIYKLKYGAGCLKCRT